MLIPSHATTQPGAKSPATGIGINNVHAACTSFTALLTSWRSSRPSWGRHFYCWHACNMCFVQHVLWLQSRLQLTIETANILEDIDQQMTQLAVAAASSEEGNRGAKTRNSPDLHKFCQQMRTRLSRYFHKVLYFFCLQAAAQHTVPQYSNPCQSYNTPSFAEHVRLL